MSEKTSEGLEEVGFRVSGYLNCLSKNEDIKAAGTAKFRPPNF